jgi:hypothetical protein
MLAPSESGSKPSRPRRLRQTLPAAAAVIGATVLGALVLYFVTEGLFLLAHRVP